MSFVKSLLIVSVITKKIGPGVGQTLFAAQYMRYAKYVRNSAFSTKSPIWCLAQLLCPLKNSGQR